MGKLGNISGKEAAKAFGKAGWEAMGQVGSHLVLTSGASELIFPSPSTRNCRPVRSGP